jgi:hypothetical protein
MKNPKFIFIVNEGENSDEEYPVAFFLSQEEAVFYCSHYGYDIGKIRSYPILQFCENR